MKKLVSVLEKAQHSAFWLWVLNKVLQRTIPFNAPHHIQITSIQRNSIRVKLPYRRKNLNHLKGIHACALATASEYACGLLLISRMDPLSYRLIMKNLKIEFHQQAKTDVEIRFELEEIRVAELKEKISTTQVILERFRVKAYNTSDELLCTSELEWQLKNWKLVSAL